MKEMKVELISHTPEARKVAFTAIRTCYSHNEPSELFEGAEYEKYQETEATDGNGGTDADRLFRHIVGSGHTSTLEHINFTFAIEGISRSLLAQLTRHRAGFGFSVQSQRYVSDDSRKKKGGFQYVIPPKVKDKDAALTAYINVMASLQDAYDLLVDLGIPKEDARFVLPNAAATNLTMTANLRALLTFYSKRKPGRGAQWEIADFAEMVRAEVVKAEPWTAPFFEQA
ncbi:thymidylate synthase [Paenibacillus sp. 32O-W]|uniref:FAD-dependent thymidylate synthase n=1 Tax=Paenibacillus sp. 32O-W TaxID=1695218 RepID=UPI0007219F61|nr:FAD-dependent thymidylate synthase [Paenibacillus sp. 32O-W]ALS29250.1 thymidylate synthase [Paenibacillus sp. 32O-W]